MDLVLSNCFQASLFHYNLHQKGTVYCEMVFATIPLNLGRKIVTGYFLILINIG